MQVVIYTPFVIRKQRRRYISLNSPLDRSSILSFWFGMVWYSTYLTKKSTKKKLYVYIYIKYIHYKVDRGLVLDWSMGKVQNKYMDKVENISWSTDDRL